MMKREEKRRAQAASVAAPLTLLAGLALSTAVYGAEWKVEPRVDVGAFRDDNILLTTAPHSSTSGYVASTRMDLERNTDVSKADIRGFISRSAYDSSDIEDKTEYGVRLNNRMQTSERGTLGLDAEYRRDTLYRTVVIERDGVGDVRDIDVGLSTRSEVRRKYRVIQPSWQWLLTERSAMQFSYRLTDANFDREAGTGLFDYKEDRLSGRYSRQLNPRDDLIVTTNFSRFRPDVVDTEAETVQLLVGMAREFSETLEGSASIGGSRTKEQAGTREESSSGTVLSATLRQRSELSTLEGVISRDVNPSGIGRALRTDQVRVHWVRRLSPTVDFVLDGRLVRARLVEGIDTGANRRYYQISPQLRWQWLEDLSIVGSYNHREQKYDAASESADSSAIFLGLSYRL